MLYVDAINLHYGAAQALRRVSVAAETGKVTCVMGRNGVGKTSLMRAIVGHQPISAGHIRLDGRAVSDKSKHVPPERRDLGMVFQDYALWPHMSVGSNVAFPLKMRRVPRGDIAARVAQALALVGLPGLESRRPAQLSGGQQQRVSLARAIVARPKLLLFDEPLSNLDRSLRDQLSREIGSLLRHLGSTAIYVTHDHGEAHVLADTIASMSGGRIAALEGKLVKSARALSQSRKKVAEMLATSVTKELNELKMGEARFAPEVSTAGGISDWGAAGPDGVQYLIQTNAGETLRPLGKIASGGELSRLMLAIRGVLHRLPDYEVDHDNVERAETIGVTYGCFSMPVRFTPGARHRPAGSGQPIL